MGKYSRQWGFLVLTVTTLLAYLCPIAIADPKPASRIENGPTTLPADQAYTRRRDTIDLLQLIDLHRDTIRKGWVLQNGVLQPTRWDDDHGPFITVPVSVKGSYELHIRFRLAGEPLFLHVPVANNWGLLVLTNARQSFENIQEQHGALVGNVVIPLNADTEAVFRVSCKSDGSARFILKVNDQESIVWEGNSKSVVNSVEIWGLHDQSYFGIDTKSASITGMELQASAYQVPDMGAATRPASMDTLTTEAVSIRGLKQAADAAQLTLDKVEAKAIARLEQTPEYQQANSDLLAAQAEVDTSKPGDAERETAADNKLAAQAHLAKLRDNAFSRDPATVTASQQVIYTSAKYQAAVRQWEADQAAANATAAAEREQNTIEQERKAAEQARKQQDTIKAAAPEQAQVRTWQCWVSVILDTSFGNVHSYRDYVQASSYEEASDMFHNKHPNENVEQIEEKQP